MFIICIACVVCMLEAVWVLKEPIWNLDTQPKSGIVLLKLFKPSSPRVNKLSLNYFFFLGTRFLIIIPFFFFKISSSNYKFS